jgi:hypothetical protein
LEGQKRGIGRIRYNASINRAIETRHKTIKHEMIDDKIKEGYSFGVERRKSKTGKIYRYLYRQKRNVHGKTKEHISLRAKNLDDYRDRVLLEQARKEVLNGFGGWADEGLTHSERKTFKILSEECLRNPKLDDRNLIAERYIKQLNMKVRGRGRFITSDNIPMEKQKKILWAAKKALDKWEESHSKLMKIIQSTFNGIYSSEENVFASFIENLVRESKCRNSVRKLKQYITQLAAQNCNSSYSILKSSEIRLVAMEVLWISKRLRRSSF